MNTPAHLIFGLAVFGRPNASRITAAALAGALIPDASLYVMVGWSLFVMGIDTRIVFGELYFSDLWQAVFRIDNSFILWGAGFAAALWSRLDWAIALCGAALLHLLFDFPLHHDDGRAHFWPLTDWIYQSPLSYWDRNHYAGIVAPIEMVMSLIAGAFIVRRFWGSKLIVGLSGVLMAAQVVPGLIWAFVF